MIKLSHVVWLAVAAAAIVGIVAGIRAVGRGSDDASKNLNALLSVQVSAAGTVAAENVRAGISALDTFFAANGTYDGATTEKLRELNPGLDSSVTVVWSRPDAACLQSTVENATVSVTRPNGDVINGPC